MAYEQIAEAHPKLVQFRHRDQWTGLPNLAISSGTPLAVFLAEHKPTTYSEVEGDGALQAPRRLLPLARPLIFQEALHLLFGLCFVHTPSIVLGNLRTETCCLSMTSQRAGKHM